MRRFILALALALALALIAGCSTEPGVTLHEAAANWERRFSGYVPRAELLVSVRERGAVRVVFLDAAGVEVDDGLELVQPSDNQQRIVVTGTGMQEAPRAGWRYEVRAEPVGQAAQAIGEGEVAPTISE